MVLGYRRDAVWDCARACRRHAGGAAALHQVGTSRAAAMGLVGLLSRGSRRLRLGSRSNSSSPFNPLSPTNIELKGALVGGQAGYNWQSGVLLGGLEDRYDVDQNQRQFYRVPHKRDLCGRSIRTRPDQLHGRRGHASACCHRRASFCTERAEPLGRRPHKRRIFPKRLSQALFWSRAQWCRQRDLDGRRAPAQRQCWLRWACRIGSCGPNICITTSAEKQVRRLSS